MYDIVAEHGFDQKTYGLRAQHVATMLLCSLFILSANVRQFKAIQQALNEILCHEYTLKNTPKHSLRMGGMYKKFVGLTKNAVFKTFHNVTSTHMLMRTTPAGIASMLTYVSSEVGEPEVPKPNYYLKSYFKNNFALAHFQR